MAAILRNTTSVHVDTDSLRMGAHNITGVIFVRVGDDYFPEREWSDFPVVILGWWLTELLGLWHGESAIEGAVICAFMDGDYYFSVSAHGEQWLIECVDGRAGGEVAAETEVRRAMFMKEVLTGAAQVLDACHAHGWRTRDTDELATIIARVEAETVLQAA